jgi:hypothetical protein
MTCELARWMACMERPRPVGVWDPRDPASCATVEFLVNGVVVHRAEGKIYRDDVKSCGFGTGYAGFVATLPITADENGVTVHARLAGTNWTLDSSPKIATRSRSSV